VDLVCARGTHKTRRTLQRHKGAALVPAMIGEQVAAIRRLRGPREREERIALILAAMEKGAVEIEANPSLAFSGHTSLGRAIQLSRENGFLECGLLQ
jgi:hypothetical protein